MINAYLLFVARRHHRIATHKLKADERQFLTGPSHFLFPVHVARCKRSLGGLF